MMMVHTILMFEDGERKRVVGVTQLQIKGGDNGDNDDDDTSDMGDDRWSKSKTRRRGDRVEAKVKGWMEYYGGEVTRVNDDDTYDIKFNDGERKRGVKRSEIKGGDDDGDNDDDYDASDMDDDRRSKSKKRRLGDRVEAKVKGWTKYYGGEIIRVNDDGTYDIKFDDGERKRGVKNSEIKGGDDDVSDRDDRRSRSKSPKKKSSVKKIRRGDRVEAKVKGGTKY